MGKVWVWVWVWSKGLFVLSSQSTHDPFPFPFLPFSSTSSFLLLPVRAVARFLIVQGAFLRSVPRERKEGPCSGGGRVSSKKNPSWMRLRVSLSFSRTWGSREQHIPRRAREGLPTPHRRRRRRSRACCSMERDPPSQGYGNIFQELEPSPPAVMIAWSIIQYLRNNPLAGTELAIVAKKGVALRKGEP